MESLTDVSDAVRLDESASLPDLGIPRLRKRQDQRESGSRSPLETGLGGKFNLQGHGILVNRLTQRRLLVQLS